ncbi:hypothetical protein GCM10010532_111120 [Dactylosporangium siamense]
MAGLLARRFGLTATLGIAACATLTAVSAAPAAAAIAGSDPNAQFWLSDGNATSILRIDPDGTKVTLGGGLSNPIDLAVDRDGTVYVADNSNQRIVKITYAGTQTTLGFTGLTSPYGVAVDSNGAVYATNGGTVLKLTTGGVQTTFATGLSDAWGMAVDASGNLFVAESTGGQVSKVTPGGTKTVFATGLGSPTGLTLDHAGRVFVSDGDNSQVVRFDADGTNPTNVTTGTGYSHALAVDALGDIFAGSTTGSTLYKTTSTGTRTSLLTGLSGPYGVGVISVPAAPTSLTLTPGPSRAGVSFVPPDDDGGTTITGYQYSLDGTTWTTLPTSAGTGGTRTATVTGLTDGAAYTLRVRAMNRIAGGPAASSSVTPNPTAPAAPTSLVVTPANGSATVTFQPPTDDGGSPLLDYQWSLDGTSWNTLSTTPATGGARTGTVTGLTNATPYTVRVRATNAIGQSTPVSGAVTPVPTAPGVPVNLVATRGDSQVTVTYQAPADDGGSPVTGYEYSLNGTTWIALPGNNIITGLTNGTAYTVRVRAKNSVGGGIAASQPATPATVPTVPLSVSATGGNGRAVLTFSPPASDGGDPVTGYQYSLNGSSWTAVPGNNTITGLVNGTAYAVQLRAANSVGPGAAASTPVTPQATVPGPVTAYTATAGNTSALLAFQPPADNGGATITGYQYSLDGTTWNPLGTDRTVTGLTNGTPYTVRVRAVNQIGGGAGTTAAVTPAPVPPGPPTALSARPAAQGATLTFRPPADDGGAAITGYQVSTDGGSTWQALTTTPGTAGALTATVTGLTDGQSYEVTVRARNAPGAGTASAPASVTAGTPLPPVDVQTNAGVSSVVVTWSAPPANGVTITGYTVTAAPGPATCTVTATTCVLGGIAGTSYTVTVVAHAGNRTSAPSAASGAAVPTSPPVTTTPPDTSLTLTTDRGAISTTAPGEDVVVIGTGFAPFSTAVITLYSTPTVLGTVTTDASGGFTKSVRVPAGLEPGEHAFVAAGVDPDGATHTMKLAVTVQAAGSLPVTGVPVAGFLIAGIAIVMTGGAMVLLSRPGPRRSTGRAR